MINPEKDFLHFLVDWGLLQSAISFYEEEEIEQVGVPWLVTSASDSLTRPEDKPPLPVQGSYVLPGSGEQSFLDCLAYLEEGKRYMALTPCWRISDVGESPWHFPWFMKLELFSWHREEEDAKRDSQTFMKLAYEFCTSVLGSSSLGFLNEGEQFDIFATGLKEGSGMEEGCVELGTYGWRKHPSGVFWSYGTGCAEPRLHRVRDSLAGYHKKPIQKGKLGELSKIREELDEFFDAQEQGVRVMELVELSDLWGAMDHYLNNYHPGYTMEDLKEMSEVTYRAFNSGRRE